GRPEPAEELPQDGLWRGAAGPHLHRHDRCALLWPLRQYPGHGLWAEIYGNPRLRRAREHRVDPQGHAVGGAVHRRLVRCGEGGLMSIPVFYAPQQERHDPRTFIFRGQVTQSPEQAERAHVFLKAAKAAGHDVRAPEDRGEAPIRAIHDAGYVDFLKTAHADWSALPNASAEITPNVHPSRHMA